MTVDQGIWGSSRQTAATYDRLYDIMPGTKSVSEKVYFFFLRFTGSLLNFVHDMCYIVHSITNLSWCFRYSSS